MGDGSSGASPNPELLKRMEAEGFRQIEAWQFDPLCNLDTPSANKAEHERIKAAERQARKTIRDAEKEWRRCYAKAPDDDDAREIVSMVGKAIKEPEIRKAIRLALANPKSVFVGEKVRTLNGIRGLLIRNLLGPITLSKPLGNP